MDFTVLGINIFVLYACIAGIYLTSVGLLEILYKERAAYFWSIFVQKKYFFLYGGGLTLGSLPLTGYSGYFSPFIFTVGAFFAVLGPVVLLYPNIMVKAYSEIEQQEDLSMVTLVRFDGILRIITGSLFIVGSLLTIFIK